VSLSHSQHNGVRRYLLGSLTRYPAYAVRPSRAWIATWQPAALINDVSIRLWDSQPPRGLGECCSSNSFYYATNGTQPTPVPHHPCTPTRARPFARGVARFTQTFDAPSSLLALHRAICHRAPSRRGIHMRAGGREVVACRGYRGDASVCGSRRVCVQVRPPCRDLCHRWLTSTDASS
jgi:hypothetical protein